MLTLTESEYQLEAQPKLYQIFAHDDAFTKLFAPDVLEKMIIAPYKYLIEPPIIQCPNKRKNFAKKN